MIQQIQIEHHNVSGTMPGCNGGKTDRIPALVWIGEMHTGQQVNNGDNFGS